MAKSDPYIFCFYDQTALDDSDVRQYTRSREVGNVTIVAPIPFRGPGKANEAIAEVPKPASFYDAKPVLLVSGDQRVNVSQAGSSGYHDAIQSLGEKFQQNPEIMMMFPQGIDGTDGRTSRRKVENVRQSVRDTFFFKPPTVGQFQYAT